MTSIFSHRNEPAGQEGQRGISVGMLLDAKARPGPFPCCCLDASQGERAGVVCGHLARTSS